MYKPKHLKKSAHPRFPELAVMAMVIVAIICGICSVPVGEASPVDADEIPIFETTPTAAAPIEEKELWEALVTDPTVPRVTAEPTKPTEETQLPEVVLEEYDFTKTPGELYSVDDLDMWEYVALNDNVLYAEEIFYMVVTCRELLSYECYPGETLVQALAKTVTAEIGGLTERQAYSTPQMEEAAVVWCVLNRADHEMDPSAQNVAKLLKAPGQFAYRSWTEIHEGHEELVVDVLIRWKLEKSGLLEDCGRVLPLEYRYFHGDGVHNRFRSNYNSYNYWDWSLPDPYKEG